MKRKFIPLAALLLLAVAVPFFALQVQGETDAGPDQTVYVDNTVTFNATTTEDLETVGNVTWDFGDGSQPVNGTDSNLLNTTYTYNATGEYNVTLSVYYDSQLNKTESDTLTITVVENVPPVADAGANQTVEQTSPAGAEVTLNGSASTDQYGDSLTYSWTWAGGSASEAEPTVVLPQGTTGIVLTVDDGVFTSTDNVTVTVVDTTAPDVDAGENMTIEATSSAGAEVMVYGNATDVVDVDLDVVWSEGGNVLGTEINLTTTLSLGVHNLTLNATDDSGNTGADNVTVEIVDTTAPTVDAGEDMTVEATSPAGVEVTLYGNATDVVDLDLDLVWKEGDTVLGTDTNLTTTLSLGTHSLTLNATDDSGNTATDTVVVDIVDTTAPDVDAGGDVTVEATSPAGAEVLVQGEASDIVDLDLDLVWTEGSVVLGTEANLTYTFGLGTHVLAFSATDDSGNTATDNVTITVVDTTPPDVDAGDDLTVEATSYAGAEVTIQGIATDIVDLNLDYVWTEGSVVLSTEANLTYTFSLGTHVLTLSATDDSGNTGTDSVTAEIVDTTPPEINISVVPDILWPPNHKYATVETVVTVYDIADPSPTLTLVSVASNEPENAQGDGNTTDDIVILDMNTFMLRAERSGRGEGRTYTITYGATDASGNYAEASITITVPHNQ